MIIATIILCLVRRSVPKIWPKWLDLYFKFEVAFKYYNLYLLKSKLFYESSTSINFVIIVKIWLQIWFRRGDFDDTLYHLFFTSAKWQRRNLSLISLARIRHLWLWKGYWPPKVIRGLSVWGKGRAWEDFVVTTTGSPSSRHERISVDLQGIIWRLLNFRFFTLNLNKI